MGLALKDSAVAGFDPAAAAMDVVAPFSTDDGPDTGFAETEQY